MLTINLVSVASYLVLYTNAGFEEKVEILLHRRQIRECEVEGGKGLFHLKIGMTILLCCIGILLLLISLGIVKGLLGLFVSPKIGMFGMNVLIDLPRPMKHYYELELAGLEVVYDIVGWPVHPQTGQRTVRPVSTYVCHFSGKRRSFSVIFLRNTEFCMNVVFFLTYPFIMLIGLCSLCCYKSYDEEELDNEIYENVNTVVFSECPRSQVKECKDKVSLTLNSFSSYFIQHLIRVNYAEEVAFRKIFTKMKIRQKKPTPNMFCNK